MCALLANLHLRFRQARLPDAHRFREFGDEELILIGRAHLSLVGDPKGLHRQRAGWHRHDGLVGHLHLRSFLRHCTAPSEDHVKLMSVLHFEQWPAPATVNATPRTCTLARSLSVIDQ